MWDRLFFSWENSSSSTNEKCHLGIEDLCGKRDELQRQILIEEEDKHKLENEIRLASEKLAKINENLAKKTTARTEFDRTIGETEAAYMKILESSQTLLNVTKFIFSSASSFYSPILGTQTRITFPTYKSRWLNLHHQIEYFHLFLFTSDTFICMLERNIKSVNQQEHSIVFCWQTMSQHGMI